MSREELMVAVLVAWRSQSCSDARAVAGTISRAAASAAISESFIIATLVLAAAADHEVDLRAGRQHLLRFAALRDHLAVLDFAREAAGDLAGGAVRVGERLLGGGERLADHVRDRATVLRRGAERARDRRRRVVVRVPGLGSGDRAGARAGQVDPGGAERAAAGRGERDRQTGARARAEREVRVALRAAGQRSERDRLAALRDR